MLSNDSLSGNPILHGVGHPVWNFSQYSNFNLEKLVNPEQMLLLADHLAQIAAVLGDVQKSYEKDAWRELCGVITDLRLAAGGSTTALHRLQQKAKR